MFAAYCDEYPEMEKLWEQYHTAPDAKELIENEALWLTKDKAEATRSLSGKMINILKDIMPNMIGGSADLAPSNKTAMKDAGDFSAENPAGRNLHFGVKRACNDSDRQRYHASRGLRAYVATFFVFSDYVNRWRDFPH